MSKIKLAMVGCGGMGGAHLRRFNTLSDRLTLAAAVDVIPERAQAVAEQFPDARVTTDYRDVLGDVLR